MDMKQNMLIYFFILMLMSRENKIEIIIRIKIVIRKKMRYLLGKK